MQCRHHKKAFEVCLDACFVLVYKMVVVSLTCLTKPISVFCLCVMPSLIDPTLAHS